MPSPTPTLTGNVLLDSALKSGNPAALTDHKSILRRAQLLAQQYKQQQQAITADVFNGIQDFSYAPGQHSVTITPFISTSASPLLVSDSGEVLAAWSQQGSGKAVAYGNDIFSALAAPAPATYLKQHLPILKRVLAWQLTGKANTAIGSTIRVAASGYSATPVVTTLKAMGWNAEAVSCNVAEENTCWQNSDLIVFGRGVPDNPIVSTLTSRYLSAGKPVLYVHNSWSAGNGQHVLTSMGMIIGGYPGNYFAGNGINIAAGLTLADHLKRLDQMGSLADTLAMLQNDQLVHDWSDTTPIGPIDDLRAEIRGFDNRGLDIFTQPNTELHRLLLLWADVWRPNVHYGPLNKTGPAIDFLRAMASDSWVAFARRYTKTSADQGDYMPAIAQTLAPSSTAEIIEVTIAQGSGNTAIGRGAIPGKPVEIEIVDAAGASSLGVRTNYLRTQGNPLSDNYERPRYPTSGVVPLPTSGTRIFTTPFGGPLFLNYNGAQAGSVVKLRVKGVVKYSHFDFTRTMSATELSEARAAAQRKDFGWQTIKLVGGEVQQVAKFINANADPERYVQTELKGMLFDSNHITNGYSNMPMSANVAAVCSAFGWTCDGPLHRAPNVQHFVGWLAACGFLCSGNPSDGSAAVGGTGWGWSHELGHNTVQRVMSISFNGEGCVTECNNNILASAHMMRQYKLIGVDTGHVTNHPALYQYIVANRASGLTGNDKVLDMQHRLWTMNAQDPMRAVHFQLAFLFSRYRANEAIPSMEASMDYFTLLTKGDRLVARAWDANNKDKYGMGRFTDNTISNPDLLFVLSSKIIGRDLRNIFAMYGITLSQTALDSVADLNLPVLPEQFYALERSKFNQVSTGQWLDLSATTPAYPF
ncbi:ImpA family metalloprotease [Chitinilyticum aquatile]|uniref:ImpA family metalloprotease n=1 Tax=Chitinilyticum aquatile TaxID=362520 RepID=UPI0012DF8ABC|nr:ImpA family metalloprotease [Chitinilyticum aquatile]